MAMASIIIIAGIISGDIPYEMGAALSLLISVVGGYFAADSLTKLRGQYGNDKAQP